MRIAVIIFCSLVLVIGASEARDSCNAPTNVELKAFFENKGLWTEVQSVDSNIIASRKVIQLDIDFSQPKESKIKKGGKVLGDFFGLCTNDKRDTLFISTTLAEIVLRKTKHGSIESKLTAFGFNFSYYYLPDAQVRRDTANIASDASEWNHTPALKSKLSEERKISSDLSE